MKERPSTPRKRRTIEGVALILIAVSAILFQRSATASWAEARTAQGLRIEVSPIGLAEHGPSSTRQCRWWPHVGDAELCAVAADGKASKSQVRRAYPLAVIALWSSVLALFLCALRVPRGAPWIGIGVTASVPIVGAFAIWSLQAATKAFVSLAGVELYFANGGFASILGGAVLMGIAAALLLFSESHQRTGPQVS